MHTVFVGGGQGCRAVLELFEQGQLAISDFEILAVVDVDPHAPAMDFARQHGWCTLSSLEQALALPELDLVVELTGDDRVVEQIYTQLPPGVRVMDHVTARVFWDLEEVAQAQRLQLVRQAELEAAIDSDRDALRQILDNLPDAVLVLDAERRIQRVNRRLETVTGRHRDELEGLHCQADLLFPAGRCACHDCPSTCEQVLRHGRATSQLVTRRDAQGEPIYLQVAMTPLRDARSQVTQVLRTSRDITEQVRAKRETEGWARRFHQIARGVHSILAIKNRNGCYRLVNPHAAALLGRDASNMLGHSDRELFDPQLAQVLESGDKKALVAGGYHAGEESLCIDGVEHQLVSERFTLTDVEGEVADLCWVARDVTQARLLQRDLVQTERLAAIGKLAAGVAHELNNPLTGILTFAEDLLLEAKPGDPRRSDYELIVNEAVRCRRIVRDLLDFSRQRAPERQRVRVVEVVRRALALVRRQATFRNIHFETEFADNLPELDLDPAQLQQAVLNLVINARDAMAGVGQITVRAQPASEERGVSIEIQDRGRGIAAELQHQIFEPFFSTKGELGNGLGLPAVKSVVEQHGGEVQLESEPGVGSTFRLVFHEAATAAPGGVRHERPAEPLDGNERRP